MKKPQIIPKVGDKLVQPFGTYLGLPDGGNIKPGEALTITKVSPQYRFVTVQTEDGRSRFTHFDSGYKKQYPAPDPFSDEALGQRTPEAIAQDDRQAADPYSDARYYDALVVIANEQGAGRYARAINLVAKIWQKSPDQVLRDAVML